MFSTSRRWGKPTSDRRESATGVPPRGRSASVRAGRRRHPRTSVGRRVGSGAAGRRSPSPAVAVMSGAGGGDDDVISGWWEQTGAVPPGVVPTVETGVRRAPPTVARSGSDVGTQRPRSRSRSRSRPRSRGSSRWTLPGGARTDVGQYVDQYREETAESAAAAEQRRRHTAMGLVPGVSGAVHTATQGVKAVLDGVVWTDESTGTDTDLSPESAREVAAALASSPTGKAAAMHHASPGAGAGSGSGSGAKNTSSSSSGDDDVMPYHLFTDRARRRVVSATHKSRDVPPSMIEVFVNGDMRRDGGLAETFHIREGDRLAAQSVVMPMEPVNVVVTDRKGRTWSAAVSHGADVRFRDGFYKVRLEAATSTQTRDITVVSRRFETTPGQVVLDLLHEGATARDMMNRDIEASRRAELAIRRRERQLAAVRRRKQWAAAAKLAREVATQRAAAALGPAPVLGEPRDAGEATGIVFFVGGRRAYPAPYIGDSTVLTVAVGAVVYAQTVDGGAVDYRDPATRDDWVRIVPPGAVVTHATMRVVQYRVAGRTDAVRHVFVKTVSK